MSLQRLEFSLILARHLENFLGFDRRHHCPDRLWPISVNRGTWWGKGGWTEPGCLQSKIVNWLVSALGNQRSTLMRHSWRDLIIIGKILSSGLIKVRSLRNRRQKWNPRQTSVVRYTYSLKRVEVTLMQKPETGIWLLYKHCKVGINQKKKMK